MTIDSSTKRSIRTMALRAIALRSNNWEPLVEHLLKSYEETGTGIYLFEACKLKFDLRDWDFVADHSTDLIKTIQTSDAFRLAIYSARNARRPEQCLQLIKQYQAEFGEDLPSDIWRVEIYCVAKIDLPSALNSTKKLVSSDPSTVNILLEVEMHHRMGDLKGVAVSARELLNREDIEPRDLLWIAKWVYVEHRELAIAFWRRAQTAALNDPDLLAFLIVLGFTLGLDKEIQPLMKKMSEYTAEGKGPIKSFSLEEFSDWAKQRNEYIGIILRNYAKGAIPIHIVANEVGITLAEALHLSAEENRKNGNLVFGSKIFIRHGGKLVNEELARQLNSSRFHMDISALLVAEGIGILSKVEQCFRPIYISPETTKTLNLQRTELASHQPSQLSVFQRILDLLEKKLTPFHDLPKVPVELEPLIDQMGKKWVSVLQKAVEENGYIVDYLPLRSHKRPRSTVTVSASYTNRITNCRAILESLKADGGLSTIAYDQSLDGLGSERKDGLHSPVPPIGAKLFLVGNTIDFLIHANLIDLVCEKFQVYLDPTYIDEARNVMEQVATKDRLGAWLERLTDRINSGLSSGIYKNIEATKTWKEIAEEDERINLDFLIATHLLQYEAKEKDILWFDDRVLNSYSTRDKIIPIIGINEVLESLWFRGELTDQEYYYKLLELRASNFRYIPITQQEILYHLKQIQLAPNGKVIETSELATLRKYYAACLLDSEFLQKPPMPEGFSNKTGEMAFLAKANTAVIDSILNVWSDENTAVEVARARTDYLLNNFFTGLFGMIHLLPNPEIRGDGLNEIGTDFGSLLGGAFAIGIGNLGSGKLRGQGYNRRKEFFTWIENNVLLPRLKADPSSIDAIASVLGMLLIRGKDEEYETPELEKYHRAFKAFFYEDLPKSIKDRLVENGELTEWLGVETVEGVPIGSYAFEASDYWRAVESAYNGQDATIKSFGGDDDFTFRKFVEDEAIGFEIVANEGKIVSRFVDPILELLSKDPKEREAALRQNRLWFECDQEIFEKEIEEIIRISDARARLDRINTWRNISAEHYYQGLEEKLTSTKSFAWSELMPNEARSLLRHLRIGVSSDVIDAGNIIAKSSELLLAEEGLDSALSKMARLPIRMPQRLIQEFSVSPVEIKESLINKYKSSWIPPISKIHLLEIVLHSGLEKEYIVENAGACLNELLDEKSGDAFFEAFQSILLYVNTEFGYSSGFKDLPLPVKLILLWAHACRLHNAFIKSGAEPEDIANLFPPAGQPMSTDILDRDPNFWNDVLHPRRISREIFLTHGVAHILQGVDRELLEEIKVAEAVGKFSFGEDSQRKLVNLMQDPTLASDSLNSLFGGDRAKVLSILFGEENLRIFASNNLCELVRSSIEELKSDASQMKWGTIQAIIGDLPIYPSLKQPLRELLMALDVESLQESEPALALYSMRTAANQIPYFSDEELRSKIELDLRKLTAYYSAQLGNSGIKNHDQDPALSTENIIGSLVEVSLNISIRMNDPRSTSKAWSRILQSLLEIWPQVGNYIAPSFSRFVWQLPANQLQGLWKVLHALRASQSNPLR